MYYKNKIFRRGLFLLIACLWLAFFYSCSTVNYSVKETETASAGEKPFLRIETQMHTASIMQIGVDAKERYLVTASYDKTARVWDLKTGALLKILRPPMGDGNEGKLYCAAISPDSKTVALGGWTYAGTSFHNIYMFDRETGTLKHRITGLPNVILHLEYSHDGKMLAACIGGTNGIRVFNTKDYSLVFKDTDYGDSSFWADFDTKDRMVTSCLDGDIRLYDKSPGENFKLIAKKTAAGGKRPFCVRFSEDGEKIAVGFADSTKVNVLSGKDLSFLYAPDTEGIDNGILSSLAWSKDGKVLYAGGMYLDGTGTASVIRWTDSGKGSPQTIPVSTDTIMDIYPFSNDTGKERFAFGACDPAVGVLDRSGKKIWRHGPKIMNLRHTTNKLMVSENGDEISFEFVIQGPGEKKERKKAYFSLKERKLVFQDALSDKLSAPVLSASGLEITDWRNSYKPKLNGEKLFLNQYEISRSLAISPDQKHFLLGSDWILRFFDSNGIEKWQKHVPGVARAVNISGDGRIAVAAFGDGTIRWFSTKDGTELMALFALPDASSWLLFTPHGFFDTDDGGGGEKLAGYHVNQGADKEGIFIKTEQLYDLFYRPDIVQKALDKNFEDEILSEAAKIDVNEILAKSIPPDIEIDYKP